jgi:hypothetical protein
LILKEWFVIPLYPVEISFGQIITQNLSAYFNCYDQYCAISPTFILTCDGQSRPDSGGQGSSGTCRETNVRDRPYKAMKAT